MKKEKASRSRTEKNNNLKQTYISMLPNAQRHSSVSVVVGMICRGLVAAALVFALVLFFADAMLIVEETVPFETVLWTSAVFTALIEAMCINKYARAVGFVLIPSGFAVWAEIFAEYSPIEYLIRMITLFVNTVIDRVAFAGLSELKLYRLDENYLFCDAYMLMKAALALFTLLIAAVTVPAIVKKVKLVRIAAVGALIIVPIVSYNIMRDNWGFSMLVVSYCAVIALRNYEKHYLSKNKSATVCTDMSELSESLESHAELDGEALKRREKRKKQTKKSDIDALPMLETRADRRKRLKSERAAAKAAEKANKKLKKESGKSISEGDAIANAALGGPVGAAVLVVMLVLIILPTVLISDYTVGIPYIGDVVGHARLYVTAALSGNEIDLNEADATSSLRDVSVKYPEYQEIIVATVEAPYNTPVYLRNWIGIDYSENKWHTAEINDVKAYRERFGDDFTPELISESFWRTVNPKFDLFVDTSGYKNNIEHGFITERVNITKASGAGVLLYVPSFALPSVGIRRYNSLESSFLPYEIYYDGIWTSKFFIGGTKYSTVSNVTSMKHPDIGKTLVNDIDYYNRSMTYIKNEADAAIKDGSAETLVKTYESELEMLGISYSGESILYRYCFEMTDEERKALIAADELEEKYGAYVRDSYMQTDPEDRAELKQLAIDILQDACDNGAFSGRLPLTVMKNIGGVHYDDDFYEQYYHEIALVLIKYLTDNIEYRIEAGDEAETETVSDENDDSETTKTALLEFLTETKQGYCVQYASALTMMLRSLGIPARYCEGFLATEYSTDFYGNDDPMTRYKCNVYDSDAHAWVEIYYEALGWVQYEATTPFVAAMYESSKSDINNDVTEVPIKDPSDTTPDVPETDSEKPDDVVPSTSETDLKRVLVSAALTSAMILIVGGAVIVIRFFVRANKRIKNRNLLINFASDESNEYSSDEEMRKAAADVIGEIFAVYKVIELLPDAGELPGEYVARLTETIGDASLIGAEVVFKAIEKEEFGYGMSRRELAVVSSYCSELISSVYDGLGRFDRIRMKYRR